MYFSCKASLLLACTVSAAGGLMTPAPASAAATLISSYGFDNTLAANEAGSPALGLIDPTGTSGFSTDTVFGVTRTVFDFNGNPDPTTGQSGLSYAPPANLTPNSYSIALTFKFDGRENAWRRIFDVTGRSSDSGFYVDPSNQLDIYPVSGSSVAFNSGEYRNVVLTVDDGTISAYIDGGHSFSTSSTSLDIGANPLIFFADNIAGGGQGEWSAGSIAALRIYDGVLSAQEISALDGDPFVSPAAVPEPASWVMFIGGFGLVGGAMRRRRREVISFA